MNGLKKIWNLIFQNLKLLRYGNDDDIKENTFYKTKCNEKIKVVEHAKDLGIIMSGSGNFKQHIGLW